MRFRLLIIPAIVLLVAGCTGQADPTATVLPPESSPAADATEPGLLIVTREPATEAAAGALPIPGVGTLVASETEDPNAGKPFETILLIRSGGDPENPDAVEINLNGDGTFTRNGVAGTLSPERVQAIIDLIDRVNFFGMQGMMLGPAGGSGVYQYGVTITRAGVSRTISSMDGFMPQEYIQLVGAIFETGLRP